MSSKTDIANRALSKLGQGRISNIETVDTKPARVLNGMFDSVRDAMIQAYPWKFAGYRAVLAADSTAPSFDWDLQYTLPSDYLAMRSIKDDPEYTIEGGADETLKILTDALAPLYIRYTRRITNTGQFHPLFDEALASRLAYEACEEITDSNTKKEAALRDMEIAITLAYRIDAIEIPPEELSESEWITARL